LVHTILAKSNTSSVLDIGCGSGRFAKRVTAAGIRVVGVDPRVDPSASDMVDLRKARYQHLELREQFDAAVAIFVLHALSAAERQEILAKAMASDVRRDGVVVVADYQLGSDTSLLRRVIIEADEVLASLLERDWRHYAEFKKYVFGAVAGEELAVQMKRAAFRGIVYLVEYPSLRIKRFTLHADDRYRMYVTTVESPFE
jgi:2-polyprenyl-3-methyl-5-hydroxy-6-metoxy-1,4-benzoquinol methylase